MPDAAQAASSSSSGCAARSALARPTPNDTAARTSARMAGTRDAIASNGMSSRTAAFPHAMSKPTPDTLTWFS